MSSSIDNLPRDLGDRIGGYRISIKEAEKLGIKIRVDPKFENVGRGQNVALIWQRNAYRWITFDDIQKLTWNLSEPITERNAVIDDNSARLLVENGTFLEYLIRR